MQHYAVQWALINLSEPLCARERRLANIGIMSLIILSASTTINTAATAVLLV